MSGKQFIPNFNAPETPQKQPASNDAPDSLATSFIQVAKYLVLSLFALVPLFFVPGLYASLGFDKTFLTIIIAGISVVICCFLALRLKSVTTTTPVAIGFYWLFIVGALVSALYVGDIGDSVRGSFMEVQTVSFLAVLGLVMLLPLFFQSDIKNSVRAIVLYVSVAGILLAYNAIRILAGGAIISFGSFNSLTISPIGNFNDLALFSALSIILALLFLVRLKLPTLINGLLTALVVLALFLLAVINFFDLWLIIGLLSLILLTYLLAKDKLSAEPIMESEKPMFAIVVTGLVFLVSATFMVFGDTANQAVSRVASVDYAEVVPSREGTLGIARAVLSDSPLFGMGPNRFADAWRLHKDPAINSTIFWETDFNTGSGFVPTLIINTGLVGAVLFGLFQIFFVLSGIRALFANGKKDDIWYTVTLSSFVAAVFIWGTAYLYEPNQTILLIGALFTGLALAGIAELMPAKKREINLITNQRRGFIMMALAIIIVSNTVMVIMGASKQYIAQANFTEADRTVDSAEELSEAAARSYELFPDDRFLLARAQLELVKINQLLNLPNPTEEDQQEFLGAIEEAQFLIDAALSEDNTNPDNYAVLAAIYRALTLAGVNGAQERAEAALSNAQELDPQNPGYLLISAQLDISTGNTDSARQKIDESLALKRNFTQALYLLTQIDIRDGNTEAAIENTQAMISLEPRNQTRYFQLGMLQSSVGDYEAAIRAFERAIAIDRQFANARYMLALTYLELEDVDAALEQLLVVQETNQDNEELQQLITQLQNGGEVALPDLGLETPVSEIAPESVGEDVVSPIGQETDLLDTVNDQLDIDEDLLEETETVTEPSQAEEVDELEANDQGGTTTESSE
jgi:tetratricopeptide (TPR) repeat protein